MYDEILVPTDGSEAVDRALEHAVRLATDHDATLHALYVVDRRIAAANSGDLHDEVVEDLESQGEAAVAAVADAAAEAGLNAETHVAHGTPDTEIVGYADEAGIDVIVMSPEGKSPRERIRSLGSVSDRVADDASVPVFLIK
ncbi:universal stress protein [Halorubrum ezzemoulense]|uniref:Universal stress protein n=1 Tax=Halorubrum ezzemoulense TaxID=337243 RepID=A0A256J358_HALEZ|nr:universal stress protein [Halorubrum ezzemoulense]MDB2237653.1 universal stress protein [Halorubrum ezzemoulense]MDB2248853.1 universal stress protein [Halorubrum ezzemoulense]MDB9280058.1 universal stress protein [Halorubrum ezzemoulense]MDB9283576.1 universal stress protein [Halorubrum ezzemoulense]OYR63205.1 universal stress protein [Halorubrum ezzemoulense]